MKTVYPFEIPPAVADSIPAANFDGYSYADVKFHGRWDGILVINADRQCIGVYVGRRIVEYSLPFAPTEIEALRPASLANRWLASIPAGWSPYNLALCTIWIAFPVLFLLGMTLTAWFLVLLIPLFGVCSIALFSIRGFPFGRGPTFLFGLGMVMASVLVLAMRGFS
ncbi:hypothetical protein [Aeoliella mucimassa]|nr:hypothetical protein [Aeoliella mucimassa]